MKRANQVLLTSIFVLFFLCLSTAGNMQGAILQKEEPSALTNRPGLRPRNLPQYASREILVKFKEGADPQQVLRGVNIHYTSVDRLHSINGATAKFKKDYKLEKSSDGWYWFLGKNYKEENEISNEQLFQEAYKQMTPTRQALYRKYKIKLAEGESVEVALAKLKDNPDIESAYPNYIRQTFSTHNDPLYYDQWSHQNTGIEQAWDITKGDPSVVIAIVDTGVDYNHPDLAANIWHDAAGNPGRDFVDIDTSEYPSVLYQFYPGEDYTGEDNDPMDYFGHGTHCAGIAAAVEGNGIGVVGVAPKCKIMPVRVGFAIKMGPFDTGTMEDDDVARGIVYATENGANVISMSFGGGEAGTLDDELKAAHDAGIILVAAAGNSSSPEPSYPASMDEVLSVGASAGDDTRAGYSNYGCWIDVFAPGGAKDTDGGIISTVPTTGIISDPSGYAYLQGTSMACPYVAGLAALIKSQHPELSNDEIMDIIRFSGDNAACADPRCSNTQGRINAGDALQLNGFGLAITSPAEGACIRGKTDITGNAFIDSPQETFQRYELSYSPLNNSQGATLIGSSGIPIINDSLLGKWDTTLLPYGQYTLNLKMYTSKPRELSKGINVRATNNNQPPEMVRLEKISHYFEWSGEDPENDTILYSYRIDKGAWSKPTESKKENVFLICKDFPSGNHIIEVKAIDPEGLESAPLSLSFILNFPPVFDTDFSQYYYNPIKPKIDQLFEFKVTATDPEGDPVTYSAQNLPIGATFAGQTLRWTPSKWYTDAPVWVKFIASDGQSEIVDSLFIVPATPLNSNNIPPRFEEPNFYNIQAGQLLEFDVSAEDGDGDTLTYSAASFGGLPLPPGATFVGQTFSWRPLASQEGRYYITFTVSDGKDTAAMTIGFSVLAPNKPPTLYPIGNKNIVAGRLFELKVDTSDDTRPVHFKISGQPPGSEWNSAAINIATLKWTPTLDQVGAYSVTIIAYDICGAEDSETFTITVYATPPPNSPPVPIFMRDVTTTANSFWPFYYPLSAIDADNDPVTFSIVNLPKGATFADNALEWRPSLEQIGQHRILFKLSDGVNLPVQGSFVITVTGVNRPPVFNPIADKTVAEGQLLEFKVSATDPEGAYLQYLALGLPPGATFNPSTQLFSWRPTYDQAGVYSDIYFVAEETQEPLTASASLNITVTNVNRPPNLPRIADQKINAGKFFQLSINATDPDGDVLTYRGINLPRGATIDASGNFTWTPSQNQLNTYRILHEVTDNIAPAVKGSFMITVGNNFNQPPVLAPIGNKRLAEGERLNFTVSATDSDGDNLTYSATNLPQNANFDAGTQSFSWRPAYNQSGNYTGVRFSVIDGHGGSDYEDISIAVSDVNRNPVLEAIGNKNVQVGALIEFNISAADPDGDNLTYSAELGYAWDATFNHTTGSFSWRPASNLVNKNIPICFSVRDGKGGSDYEDITIAVTAANHLPVFNSIDNMNATENTPLTFKVMATDADKDILQFVKTMLPAGANFTVTDSHPGAINATFGWTPLSGQVNSYRVGFQVTDGKATSGTSTVITVKTVPVTTFFLTTSALNGSVTKNPNLARYPSNTTVQLTATPNTGYSFVNWSGDLNGNLNPANITMSSNKSVAANFALINHAPVLNAIGNKTVDAQTTLNITLSATDPDGDNLTYAVSPLPAGANFDAKNRIFSWKPATTQAGIYKDIRFSVQDGKSGRAEEAISIIVNSINHAPIMEHIGYKNATENQTLQFKVNATDPDGDSLTYSWDPFPLGLLGADFNTTTQIFSWTPNHTQIGIYSGVTFYVRDRRGAMASESITVTVTKLNHAPILNAIGSKSVNPGSVLSFTISGSDIDGDTLTYSASGLPTGANFNPASKTFSWTPTAAQASATPYKVTFKVEDGKGLSASEDVLITANLPVNHPPVLDRSILTNKTIQEGQNISFTLSAADPDGDQLTYSMPAALTPPGATLTGATFTWTPTRGQANSYRVGFRVSDGSLTDSTSIDIKVTALPNAPPVLNPIGNKSVEINKQLSFSVSATDSDPEDTLTCGLQNIPAGAVLSYNPVAKNWTFTWTPTQSGLYTTTFAITDGKGGMTQETVTITVIQPNRPPVLNSIGAKSAVTGSALTFSILATDADGDSLAYSASNLPSGASFNATTHTFSWTPTQAGLYTPTFTVTDGKGGQASEKITITVTQTNRAPSLSYISSQRVEEGKNLQFTVYATDPDGDSLTYYASNLPSGASFSGQTFSWKPKVGQAGSYTGYIGVMDSNGATDTQGVSFTVTKAPPQPTPSPVPSPSPSPSPS